MQATSIASEIAQVDPLLRRRKTDVDMVLSRYPVGLYFNSQLGLRGSGNSDAIGGILPGTSGCSVCYQCVLNNS